MSKKPRYLSDGEINEFIAFFDRGLADGAIRRHDLERHFEKTHAEFVRQSTAESPDKGTSQFQQFFSKMLGATEPLITRKHLVSLIRSWNVPSLAQVKRREAQQDNYFQRHGTWRMLRAYWAVHGHEIVFLGVVIVLIVGFAAVEIVKYSTVRYTSAFGYGVVVAKACTGALYPTFFFMTLSMSRYFSTLLRRLSRISRFLNLDLSRKFHMRISCLGLMLATVHAISHLAGTFIRGSDPANTAAVRQIIAHKIPGRRYIDYISSTPGSTGIAALSLFYILAAMSISPVRRWHYNMFQVGHLLLYPILGLMMVHGTAAILQTSIFGYVLALPTLLLLFERISRVCLSFYLVDAYVEILTDDTVEITAVMPDYRVWDYTAGQYILLQVPAISDFQWHPFTISYCCEKTIKLHIKTEGDWTSKLRNLGTGIKVAISGPFGAPAQRFHDFQHTVVIGAGIGITPFSAILADLQRKYNLNHGDNCTLIDKAQPASLARRSCPDAQKYRRTDVHWIVRDVRSLSWLSGLLNQVFIGQRRYRVSQQTTQLFINLNTHVTAKYKTITTYIFSWLLEMNRSHQHPASPLTGLLNSTCFGRPDFDRILDESYKDMRRINDGNGGGHRPDRRVGVFYCGTPEVAAILADKCTRLTARGRNDRSRIEYHFIVEVFN